MTEVCYLESFEKPCSFGEVLSQLKQQMLIPFGSEFHIVFGKIIVGLSVLGCTSKGAKDGRKRGHYAIHTIESL